MKQSAWLAGSTSWRFSGEVERNDDRRASSSTASTNPVSFPVAALLRRMITWLWLGNGVVILYIYSVITEKIKLNINWQDKTFMRKWCTKQIIVLYWASKNENEPSHWNFPKFEYEPGRFEKSTWIRAGSNPKFFDSIHFWFLPHDAQFSLVSNFDIDFINFRFVFNTKLDRGRKILQLHDMLQF